jgi:MOSC domain-containing protein YiiM
MGVAAMPSAAVLAVCTGAAVPFARGSLSGVHKTPVQGRVRVTAQGLQGDAQGDLRLHGGVEKAVHHYPQEHYAAWRAELGAHALLEAPGAFGENLHSRGLTEATVCLGDRWRVGDVLLEVTQARQPCWKLNERFGVPDMARRVQQSRRTGWYSRVVEDGELWADAAMVLEARPYPAWTLERLLDLLYRPILDGAALQATLALPLPASWQRLLQRRLDSGAVEDWAPRLEGPPA